MPLKIFRNVPAPALSKEIECWHHHDPQGTQLTVNNIVEFLERSVVGAVLHLVVVASWPHITPNHRNTVRVQFQHKWFQ